MKILIVDDSELLRERLISLISELPKIEKIAQAQDAKEAMTSFKEFNPDVVVLDIRLSEGNGIDVLQKIKEQNAGLPVIMFTNYPYPQYRKKCIQAGADFFFDKSTEFPKVIDVLKEYTHTKDFAGCAKGKKRIKTPKIDVHS